MRSNDPVIVLLLATVLVAENIDEVPLKSIKRGTNALDGHKETVTKANCTVIERCYDCSCLGLQNIPKHLPPNITCLNLRGNAISSIHSTDFLRYQHLVNLSLSNNSLQTIYEGDFMSLPSLKMLDLSLNNIRYEKIDKNAFKNLTSLCYLDLKQRAHPVPNTAYPQSLGDLKRIEYLMIDGIDSPLPDLPILKELYLSGQYGNCKILHPTGALFQNIVNIRKLYMSNCSIQEVEKGAFMNLPYLESLDLSWNTNLTFGPMYNITFGLHRTNFKRLNLNNVYEYYAYDSCTTLSEENIKNLQNTSIELITLEGNRIVRTDPSVVHTFPQTLRYASMRDNLQMFGKSTKMMIKYHTFKRIVYYDTSKMFSSHMPPFISTDTSSDIQTPDTCIPCGTIFTRDQVRTYFEVLDDRLMKFNITPIGSNKLFSDTEQYAIEYLDLSETQCDSYKVFFKLFDSPETLRYLNMYGTYLGYTLLDNSTFFDKFVSLTTLDIRTNGILDLKENIFDNLKHLERLYLGNNKIANITFNIHLMNKLTYLDLHSNHLEVLNRKVMDSLDKLQDVTVNMLNNSLACSCNQQNLEFLQWMISNRQKFEKFDQMQCVFKNGTGIAIPDLKFDLLKYECQPPTFNTLTLVTSLCILTFLLIVFGGVIYRYRWNLRYLYYMTKFKLAGGYRPIDDANFEKDIFVSYADEDAKFVREHVKAHLEDTGDFSLLVHGRDFRPGELVADNIVRAVTSSRKTLVILTKSYIRSKWCMYEMNIARLEGINTDRNVLCVVMKENIPVKTLPIEIIDIIRSRTYIDYPDSTEDHRDFWERLKITLR